MKMLDITNRGKQVADCSLNVYMFKMKIMNSLPIKLFKNFAEQSLMFKNIW